MHICIYIYIYVYVGYVYIYIYIYIYTYMLDILLSERSLVSLGQLLIIWVINFYLLYSFLLRFRTL